MRENVNIPNMTDREILVALSTDMNYLKESMDGMKGERETFEETSNNRVSKLERWQSNLVGISVGASAVVAWGIAWWKG